MYNPNTTDNQEEVYDVVNEEDEVLGTATRKQVHSDPKLIHRAAGVYIFNKKKHLLMQKRSMTKDMFPGYWVFSVGGHVNSGDSYEKTAVRELSEELGVNVPLTHWMKIFQPGVHESEFWAMFYGLHEGPFPGFNTVEAQEVRFFDIVDLITSVENGSILMPPNAVRLLPLIQTLLESGKIDQMIEETKNI
ncbi:MAG: NUDIX domain-containing protein [Candidatus Woesebacteria bacterium]